MIEWLSEFWVALSWSKILLGAGLFLFSLAVSTLAIGIVMVKIPPNYFHSDYTHNLLPGKPFLVRWSVVIIKNIVGILLVLLGIVLSLPGVPGQGILTILLGLIMIDIPGKRPLEARIVRRPTVLAAINNLRARYAKPPLLID